MRICKHLLSLWNTIFAHLVAFYGPNEERDLNSFVHFLPFENNVLFLIFDYLMIKIIAGRGYGAVQKPFIAFNEALRRQKAQLG